MGLIRPEGVERMLRHAILAIALIGVSMPAASAQAPMFRWKSGQALTYRVAQTTTAVERLKDSEPMTTTTQLDLVKRWRVLEVDAAGTATLQMSLDSLRMETRPPTGETLLFDSAKPAQSTEGLREELSKYVGPALTVVRIDARGQLIAVKESKFGPESRLQCDLPFKLVLPAGPVAAGQAWERSYQIKLEPPQGAGETFDAAQKFTCKAAANGQFVVALTTEVKTMPEAAAERLPLLPLMPSGELHFDATNGRLRAVRYQFAHELSEHRGEGSKYSLKSSYSEDLIEIK
jgi:hypothetical protein